MCGDECAWIVGASLVGVAAFAGLCGFRAGKRSRADAATRRRERAARMLECALVELQHEARALGLTLRSLLPAEATKRGDGDGKERGDE